MLLCIYVNSGRVGNNLFIYKVCVCVHMYICMIYVLKWNLPRLWKTVKHIG